MQSRQLRFPPERRCRRWCSTIQRRTRCTWLRIKLRCGARRHCGAKRCLRQQRPLLTAAPRSGERTASPASTALWGKDALSGSSNPDAFTALWGQRCSVEHRHTVRGLGSLGGVGCAGLSSAVGREHSGWRFRCVGSPARLSRSEEVCAGSEDPKLGAVTVDNYICRPVGAARHPGFRKCDEDHSHPRFVFVCSRHMASPPRKPRPVLSAIERALLLVEQSQIPVSQTRKLIAESQRLQDNRKPPCHKIARIEQELPLKSAQASGVMGGITGNTE